MHFIYISIRTRTVFSCKTHTCTHPLIQTHLDINKKHKVITPITCINSITLISSHENLTIDAPEPLWTVWSHFSGDPQHLVAICSKVQRFAANRCSSLLTAALRRPGLTASESNCVIWRRSAVWLQIATKKCQMPQNHVTSNYWQSQNALRKKISRTCAVIHALDLLLLHFFGMAYIYMYA